jgi:hypothetical protein
MQRRDRLLVLEPHTQAPQPLVVRVARERLHAARPRLQLAIELGRDGAGHQHLGAVRAQVGDRAERDDPPRVGRAAAGHARHHPIAPGDLDQRPPRALRHVGIVGVLHDRGEHPVDVEQDRRAVGGSLQRRQQLLEGSGRARHSL